MQGEVENGCMYDTAVHFFSMTETMPPVSTISRFSVILYMALSFLVDYKYRQHATITCMTMKVLIFFVNVI